MKKLAVLTVVFMTFFCVNSVQAEVLYNEATDSYTSTSEEDGTIAINGSVYDNDKYGYIDIDGNVVLEAQHDFVGRFYDEKSLVVKDDVLYQFLYKAD